jgi:predicted nucleic acid-binding protein
VPRAEPLALAAPIVNRDRNPGNLTTDTHLAALALEHGCAIYSADYDFRRFSGVIHIDPLAQNED